jgi:DNA-directed RNA polymerase subunit alpha
VFDLWTDGTLKPEDALAGAAKIMKEYLQVFINFQEEDEEEEKESDDGSGEFKSLIETPVDELELSVRASNCLRTVNIRTIGDLISRTEEDISKIRHFGKKSLLEIKEKLSKHKLSFGMHEDVVRVINKKK